MKPLRQKIHCIGCMVGDDTGEEWVCEFGYKTNADAGYPLPLEPCPKPRNAEEKEDSPRKASEE